MGKLTPFGVVALTALVAIGSASSGSSAGSRVARGSSHTLAPVGDAYVSSLKPTANYGGATVLRVDGSPIVRSYLRFDLTVLSGTVSRARLRVYPNSSASAGIEVAAVADATWTERTVTYATAPAATSGPIAASGRVTAGSWIELDVTAAVTGGGSTSLLLTTRGTTAISLASRESARPPELILETAEDVQPAFPLRAAFYYPWFPEAWRQAQLDPFTRHVPTLGYYDSSDAATIRSHIAAMQYGKIQAGIVSWWGQGSRSDGRLPTILQTTVGSSFRWAVYYEPEGQGDPTPAQIASDLAYLRQHYGSDPSYLRTGGRFVVFVYADGADGCDMADRWRQGNTAGAYVVLKVFPGYRTCGSQPDGWHQYAPAKADDSQRGYAYSISPGFWKASEDTPRLSRDLARWRQSIRSMIASGAPFQLVTTFNEWGEGTAVESATAWESASGYGEYLDALHDDGAEGATPPPTTPPPGSGTGDAVLLAAGDIASCSSSGDEATASIVAGLPGAVATLGDTVYESGTPEEFANCFEPSWGPFKPRTRPAVGNHEYLTPGAAGYFGYFGTAAGDPDKGYYSYDLGAWHVVVLNSNCSKVGGCSAGSPQEQWLRADLVAHPSACTLAYWHHPRFSSGQHGSFVSMQAIWQALYEAGAEVVLGGHDHHYERFAPQTSAGVVDPDRGIREFVVGTGGKNHYAVGPPIANSEVRDADTFGVLKLTLHPTSYDWEFLPEAGKAFTDSGAATCH